MPAPRARPLIVVPPDSPLSPAIGPSHPMTLRRASVLVPCLALTLGLAWSAASSEGEPPAEGSPTPAATAGGAPAGRVVVLGFDGADWRMTERMMAEGQLPNLQKLAAAGTAGPLVSTDPAESAAGWAAINTGANPAKNGVASFIKRSIADGQPTPVFAHVVEAAVPMAELSPGGLLGVFAKHGQVKTTVAAAALVTLALFALLKVLLRAGYLVA